VSFLSTDCEQCVVRDEEIARLTKELEEARARAHELEVAFRHLGKEPGECLGEGEEPPVVCVSHMAYEEARQDRKDLRAALADWLAGSVGDSDAYISEWTARAKAHAKALLARIKEEK
jgi:predicted RNase H-like nuclease (RuvC/YqgF family)